MWKQNTILQCCEFGSGSTWIRIHSTFLDPNSYWEWGSGPRNIEIDQNLLINLVFCLSKRLLYLCMYVFLTYDTYLAYFACKNSIFCDFLTRIRIRIRLNPHWFGVLDPDPYWSQCGSATLQFCLGQNCTYLTGENIFPNLLLTLGWDFFWDLVSFSGMASP
jgi:hypothetical protein